MSTIAISASDHDHLHLEALPVEPSELGESPFWHPDEQALYWLDRRRPDGTHALRRFQPTSGTSQAWELPEEPGCCAPALSGGVVLAMGNGFWRFRADHMSLERIATAPFSTEQQRFNDGKCDALGRFWAGTQCLDPTQATGGLYCLDPSGQVHWKAGGLDHGGVATANSLAFSPDHRHLYWGDSQAHTIWAFDLVLSLGYGLNAADVRLDNRRSLKRFAAKPPDWALGTPQALAYAGRPDGAAVDTEGGIWVAMFEGGQVIRLSPEGKLLQRVSLPTSCPTMPCFGGPGLRTLYLTTSRHRLSTQDRAREPLAGLVLSIELSVPGLPVSFFSG